jgi:hypothetical protein
VHPKFLSFECIHRDLRIQRRIVDKVEVTACHARLCIHFIEREQRARRAAGGDQETAAVESSPFCISRCILQSKLVCFPICPRQRYRLKLAVRRGIEFYR